MNSPIIETRAADDSRERLQRLSAIAGHLLDRARAAGADDDAEDSFDEDGDDET